MADIIRKRLTGREEGFTLIELLVVIVILGILLAIAVPSYMGFRDRANKSAAQADVRAAIPSVEAYYSDHGKYADDATVGNLGTFSEGWIKSNIDQGLSPAVHIKRVTDTTYCVDAAVGNYRAKVAGPGGTIAVDLSSTLAAC
jgi:prepilin-type N-terminal cleavage/methylation domain-containing protein